MGFENIPQKLSYAEPDRANRVVSTASSYYPDDRASMLYPQDQGDYAYPPTPSPPLPSEHQQTQGFEGRQMHSEEHGYGSPAMGGTPGTPDMQQGGWANAPSTPSGEYGVGSPRSPGYGDENSPFVKNEVHGQGSPNSSLSPYAHPYIDPSSDNAASKSTVFNGPTSSSTNLHKSSSGGEKAILPVLNSEKSGQPKSKKKWWWLLAVVLIAAIAAGVAIGVTRNSKNSSDTASSGSDHAGGTSGNSGHGTNSSGSASGPTTGGDGSTIVDENGNSFVYKNQFGGKWVSTPFDDSAQAQSDVPPLNQPWDYAKSRIYGVNLGGWLTLEPFISPALYEPFENAATPAIDEYTLSTNLGANLGQVLEDHYKTFITEQDFAEIAGAGLNWVRIPVPYWMIETYPGEPFLEGVSWTYFLKAITWARKYGIRINIDYHATPGSQNGWNHSSKFGTVGFLEGVMGIANAQRALNYLRTLAEFVSQPQYSNVICMLGVLNEPMYLEIGPLVMRSFYLEAYNMIRSITGFGAGNGPVLSLHDGFTGQAAWAGYLAGADRLALDTHPYLCFAPQANADTMEQNIMTPCKEWSQGYNTSMGAFGFSAAGEWSLAVNDCGVYVTGVGQGTREEGTYPTPATSTTTRHGSCDSWLDPSTWSAELKAQFVQLQYAHQDGLGNTFFWTWKIGNTTKTNPPRVANPMWSYSNGLKNGYISGTPRQAVGQCRAMASQFGVAAPQQVQWDGAFQPYQTGGAANPVIAPAQVSSYNTWPPVSIVGVGGGGSVARLPAYTPTGTPITLPVSTPTGTATGSVGPGSGWHQASDTAGYYTAIAGCNAYVDPWSGNGATPGSNAGCGAAAAKRGMPTAHPSRRNNPARYR